MKPLRWVRAAINGLIGCALIAGCSGDITGLTPKIANPSPDLPVAPVAPGVVCRDQLTTLVTVTGEDFSPLPYDLAHDARTWLPSVTLVHASTLDGAAGDGNTILWDGRPDADKANHDALSWQSQESLAFEVRPTMTLPDGATAPLPTGVFDVVITNANGGHGTSSSALALVPEPILSSATPNLVCLAEGPRVVALAGSSMLRLDGRDPALGVADVAAFALRGFDGCVDIPHPGVDASLCTAAEVEFQTDSVPLGEHALSIFNPETAACKSLDDIRLRVVPPPTIDRVEPPAECTAEATQQVVIVGTGFLDIDGNLPLATLDEASIASVSVDDCEPSPDPELRRQDLHPPHSRNPRHLSRLPRPTDLDHHQPRARGLLCDDLDGTRPRPPAGHRRHRPTRHLRRRSGPGPHPRGRLVLHGRRRIPDCHGRFDDP